MEEARQYCNTVSVNLNEARSGGEGRDEDIDAPSAENLKSVRLKTVNQIVRS